MDEKRCKRTVSACSMNLHLYRPGSWITITIKFLLYYAIIMYKVFNVYSSFIYILQITIPMTMECVMRVLNDNIVVERAHSLYANNT